MLSIARTGPEISLYTDSICIGPSALLDDSRAAVIFALLLFKIITTTVVKIATQTIKAVARELMDTKYTTIL